MVVILTPIVLMVVGIPEYIYFFLLFAVCFFSGRGVCLHLTKFPIHILLHLKMEENLLEVWRFIWSK